jgi:hypothetical protein
MLSRKRGERVQDGNLIEKCWGVYEAHQRKRGVTTDEVSFVGGFMSCFGVMTGRVDIGLAPDTTMAELFGIIQKELEDVRTRVIGAEREGRDNGG